MTAVAETAPTLGETRTAIFETFAHMSRQGDDTFRDAMPVGMTHLSIDAATSRRNDGMHKRLALSLKTFNLGVDTP